MTQDEKNRLLELFKNEHRWCKNAEARDKRGKPVHYSDKAAVAWDLIGGMCVLFGWERAVKLFIDVARHVTGQQEDWADREWTMAAMASVQDFNDKRETTYPLIIARLRSMPVHRQSPSLCVVS
jgi:hypothetical protein